MTAREACCGCGGGNRNPDTFIESQDFPIYSNSPNFELTYPSEYQQVRYIRTISIDNNNTEITIHNTLQNDYKFDYSKDSKCEECVNANCYNWKAPKIWNDNYGYDCKAYYFGQFCTPYQTEGTGWWTGYGNVIDYRNVCMNAFEACAFCKSGKK